MSDTVVSLGAETGNAAMITPEQLLKDCLQEYADGKLGGQKAILLCLDDSEGYAQAWRNAGMSCSEIIALFEVVKMDLLNHMGYVSQPGDDVCL